MVMAIGDGVPRRPSVVSMDGAAFEPSYQPKHHSRIGSSEKQPNIGSIAETQF